MAIGSVIGFFSYLSLVARIGPPRAAYVTVVSPIIALAASTFLEAYAWTPLAILGVPLILAGNFVIFAPGLPQVIRMPLLRWRLIR